MLLCIDIGNTNTTLGVFEDEKFLAEFMVESNLNQTADEYGIKVMDMFNYNNLDVEKIKGVIIASVVPGLDIIFEKMINKYLGLEALFVGPGVKSGIHIRTDNPKQLGSDILVGVVAAYYKYGAPAIIIDMGTAITLFYVDEDKELHGGVIVPGIRTSYAGLFSKTSRLEEVRPEKPLNVIGKDTVTCIQSGMLYGTTSMIDGLIRKMKKEIGKNAVVVLTGGEALAIKDFLEEDVIYDQHLVLDGLRMIFNKNN